MLFLIVIIIFGILWVHMKSKEGWENMTKPPKGWIQHKGWRQKINKP